MSKTQPSEILTKPSLSALSLMLRNPEMWPPGFSWFFGECTTCAYGLALSVYGIREGDDWVQQAAEIFGISWKDAWNLFMLAPKGIGHEDVLPEHVADAIDAYLASAA